MEEEIDIIELFKRIKEGEAPKEIEINNDKLFYKPEEKYFERLYQTENNRWWCNSSFITLDTKIKILNKPIIDLLDLSLCSYDEGCPSYIVEIQDKINEIIKHINKEEKNNGRI